MRRGHLQSIVLKIMDCFYWNFYIQNLYFEATKKMQELLPVNINTVNLTQPRKYAQHRLKKLKDERLSFMYSKIDFGHK